MDDETLIDHIVNALGSDHFNVDAVMQSLHEKIDQMQQNKENTGSMLTLINILPEITEEAKKKY